MKLDPLILSRIQFAWVIAWHILLPAFTVGAAAMSVSTIIVAANAQLLRHLKLQRDASDELSRDQRDGPSRTVVTHLRFGRGYD
jgi:hypothetical protein